MGRNGVRNVGPIGGTVPMVGLYATLMLVVKRHGIGMKGCGNEEADYIYRASQGSRELVLFGSTRI